MLIIRFNKLPQDAPIRRFGSKHCKIDCTRLTWIEQLSVLTCLLPSYFVTGLYVLSITLWSFSIMCIFWVYCAILWMEILGFDCRLAFFTINQRFYVRYAVHIAKAEELALNTHSSIFVWCRIMQRRVIISLRLLSKAGLMGSFN